MSIVINGNGTITGLAVGGLPDGVVDTDMLANNAVTSAKSSGLDGVSVATIHRVNTQWSGAADPITNWEAADASWDGHIGSMTSSSGIFTFPSTGIYGVLFKVQPYSSSYHRHTSFYIYATTNGGTGWDIAARGEITIIDPSSSNHHQGMHTIHFIFDVTNTSTHKVKFATAAGPSFTANTDCNDSYAQFTKYGDT